MVIHISATYILDSQGDDISRVELDNLVKDIIANVHPEPQSE
jgi:hypothetical protein